MSTNREYDLNVRDRLSMMHHFEYSRPDREFFLRLFASGFTLEQFNEELKYLKEQFEMYFYANSEGGPLFAESYSTILHLVECFARLKQIDLTPVLQVLMIEENHDIEESEVKAIEKSFEELENILMSGHR